MRTHAVAVVPQRTDLVDTCVVKDTINHYFSPYTFSIPSASAPFGNAGRNAFRMPDFWQWDLGVSKFFPIRENIKLQFRSEFFNVLNRTNLGLPDSNISDAAFGTIRSTFPERGRFRSR